MLAWPIATVHLQSIGFVPPKEAYPKAKEAALKALEIDDTLAEAHSLARHVSRRYMTGIGQAPRENSSELLSSIRTMRYAHLWYGLALSETGRIEEAIAEEKRALELDPLSLTYQWVLG